MEENEKQEKTAGEQDSESENEEAVPKTEEVFTGISAGVSGEEFDILPEVERNPEDDREFSEKDGVEVEYSFNGDDIREGLTVFQKATIYKKNMVYTLLLLVIFVIYIFNIIKHPEEVFSSFLAAMCIAVTAFLWYLPAKHIKKTAEAADQRNMTFGMTIYDTGVKIREENGSFILHFGKEIDRVFETKNLYLICAGKERIFMLPKRSMDSEKNRRVKETLQSAMAEKYFDQTQKAN